jgi:hypothetical protein
VAPTALRALVHFLCLGGAAALGARWLASDAAPAPIVVEVAPLEAGGGRPAAAALAARVDDEILYREALLRGFDAGDPVIAARLGQNAEFLDLGAGEAGVESARGLGLVQGDLVVRRRLIQRMRAAIEAPSWQEVPSDAELETYRAAHPGRFETPRRIAFRHVFFASARHANPIEAARRALAAARASGAPPSGDPAFAPLEQPLQTEVDLARFFGAEFAAALFDQPLGEWSGPLAVPGGAALVRVREARSARAASLSEVGARVKGALQQERAEAAVRAFLGKRRAAYPVSVVETPRASAP